MESRADREFGRSERSNARKDFLRLSGAAGLAAIGFGSGISSASAAKPHGSPDVIDTPVTPTDLGPSATVSGTLRPNSDGSDDAAAIRTAAADRFADGGGIVVLAAGRFSIRSPLALPPGVGLMGASSAATVLVVDHRLAGDVVSLDSTSGVSDIGFATVSAPRSSGSFIHVLGNECRIVRCTFTGYHVAITVGRPELSAVSCSISDSYLRAPSTSATAGAIDLVRFNSVRVTGCVVVGPGRSARQPAFGIRVGQGDTAIISDCNVTAHGVALDVTPPRGSNCTALQGTNSYFDSAGTTGSGSRLPSVRLEPAGRVFNTLFSNCWVGLADGAGCLISPVDDGAVTGLSFSGCQFIGSSAAGLLVNGEAVSDWSVVGGSSSGNNGPAIHVRGGSKDFVISGHMSGGQTNGHAVLAGRGPNQVGLRIESGSDDFVVSGCKFTGNLLGGVLDDSRASNSSVANNISSL